MKRQRRAPDEVMFWTNLIGSTALLVNMCSPLSNFEMFRVLEHFSAPAVTDLRLMLMCAAFGVSTYMGVKAYMALVAEMGGVFAVTVSTARKICTVTLSAFWFSHTMTPQHLQGGALVLAGIVLKRWPPP